jgi:hypothetical protein
MMGNNLPKAKKRNGTLIKIEHDKKEYFRIFCGGKADWTAFFDAGDGAKLIERYCSKCASVYVDSK